MKKKLLIVSMICNAALVAGLLWTHASHDQELHDWAMSMRRAEEHYVMMLDKSLSAIETPKTDEAESWTEVLRSYVAMRKNNMEAHRRAGLGQYLDG